MIKLLQKTAFCLSILGSAVVYTPNVVAGEHIFQSTPDVSFDMAKETLMSVIENKGYTVAHEQRCDAGLKKMGYESDSYRVIFFGKLDEIRQLSKKHEALVPFLPFKAAVYQEGGKTKVSVINPQFLKLFVNPDEDFYKKVDIWEKDFESIVKEVEKVNSKVATL